MTRLRNELRRGDKEIHKKQFKNPEQNRMEIMKHNNIMDKMEDDDNNWKYQELLKHRIKGRKKKQDIEVKCCWIDINQNTSQMDMFELAIQDPTAIIKYAQRRHLMPQVPIPSLYQIL